MCSNQLSYIAFNIYFFVHLSVRRTLCESAGASSTSFSEKSAFSSSTAQKSAPLFKRRTKTTRAECRHCCARRFRCCLTLALQFVGVTVLLLRRQKYRPHY